MSSRLSTAFHRRVALLAALYAVAYLAAAGCDLGTTVLALRQAGVSEGNVYATNAAGYDASRAWAINLVSGVAIEAGLIWCALRAGQVAEAWLAAPIRSFGKVYINPFARGVADRAPLHLLSYTLAFPVLRLLASANNLIIWRTGTGPLGRLVGMAGNATTPAIGFWLVLAPLFWLLTLAAAPAAARVIGWLRSAAPPILKPRAA